VLFVSTIEVRKNHQLLMRVWRRLLEEMRPSDVPWLVFVGRIGWMVDDFVRQLHACDFLNGRIIVIADATDTELAALYRSCLFTVFPSLYEGWGLPVTESLSLGKPCLASDRTSLPEAGGPFARYFDPENVAEATAAIRGAIEDRDGLRRWEDQIKREFRPTPCEDSAAELIRVLAV
jgi:glycosyltransferase involved in cell wall biosynthesis